MLVLSVTSLAISASATSFKLRASADNAVQFRNPDEGYNLTDITVSGTDITSNQGAFPMQALNGYKVARIEHANGTEFDCGSLPSECPTLLMAQIIEGETVTVVVQDPSGNVIEYPAGSDTPSFTLTSNHPELFKYMDPNNMGAGQLSLTNGKAVIDLPAAPSVFPIFSEQGNPMTSVVNQDGENVSQGQLPSETTTINTGSIKAGDVITVYIQSSESDPNTWTLKADFPEYFDWFINPATQAQQSLTAGGAVIDHPGKMPVFPLQAKEGYEIYGAFNQNNVQLIAGSLPTQSTTLNMSDINKGDVVTIKLRPAGSGEEQKRTLTFHGNPEHVSLSMNYSPLTAQDGAWTVSLAPNDDYTVVVSANPGYELNYVEDDMETRYMAEGGYVYVNTKPYQRDADFEISSNKQGEGEKAHFTVKVDGDYSLLQIRQAFGYGDILTLTGAETVVEFNPATETQYYVGRNDYKAVAEITVDGTPVPVTSASQTITVHDGSLVEILVAYPTKDVPVTFAFANPGTESVIKQVSVNYQTITDWQNGFTAKTGDNLSIVINTKQYLEYTATLNGNEIEFAESYGNVFFDYAIGNEDALQFVFNAVSVEPWKVTINSNLPEGVIYDDNYYFTNPRTISQNPEVVNIERGAGYIVFKPAVDYEIVSIVDRSDGRSYNAFDLVAVNFDKTFDIQLNKLAADASVTVWFESGAASTYRSVTVNPALSNRKEYTTLRDGYNEILCNDGDDLQIGCYPYVFLYKNGEYVGNDGTFNSYTLPGGLKVANGDVYKVFNAAPQGFAVNYNIGEGVNVEVRHDRTQVIGNPANHTLYGETEIHIVPVEAASNMFRAPADEDNALKVTVNDQPVAADEDGRFVFTVNSDATVAVTKGASAIDDITVDNGAANGDIFNLQGIRVGNVNDGRRLPAGIYVVDGKKVRL